MELGRQQLVPGQGAALQPLPRREPHLAARLLLGRRDGLGRGYRRRIGGYLSVCSWPSGIRLDKSALGERVAAALREVPRHLFVPAQIAALAYHDTPLPIGFNKTISQPFVGALMIDLLAPQPGESVLEVGTGLGYQAAVLAQLARRVWSIEIVEEFAEAAESRLQEFGLTNVAIRVGDGSRGWPEHAPFDKS